MGELISLEDQTSYVSLQAFPSRSRRAQSHVSDIISAGSGMVRLEAQASGQAAGGARDVTTSLSLLSHQTRCCAWLFNVGWVGCLILHHSNNQRDFNACTSQNSPEKQNEKMCIICVNRYTHLRNWLTQSCGWQVQIL